MRLFPEACRHKHAQQKEWAAEGTVPAPFTLRIAWHVFVRLWWAVVVPGILVVVYRPLLIAGELRLFRSLQQ